MAIQQRQKYCETCGLETLHQRELFSSGWGCFLTIITLGLFFIVWILIAAFDSFKPWRCQTCGNGRFF